MRVNLEGALGAGVSAKDLMLWLIGRESASGAKGHAVEFAGAAVRALTVEARLTLCNLAVEFSAFTGMVAPDDVVFQYLAGRRFAPTGAQWEQALAHWRTLHSAPQARFDRELNLDVSAVEPMVTWGTSPEHALGISAAVPDPAQGRDDVSRKGMARALDYMGLQPGQRLQDLPIEAAFIGSCTNSLFAPAAAACG